ncbi:MAG: hypothetical protein GXO77_14620 [Calditrichaeota bacterium]|nr:hypothetical protein [Calditrichota bacterium]
MKIAVGTDDKATIRSGHFGKSKYYRIFSVENGEIISEEIRENPFAAQDDSEHHHGRGQNIIRLLKDCNVFMAKSMGMHSVPGLVQKNIQPVIARSSDIRSTVEKYISGDLEEFRCFEAQTKKFVPCGGRKSR